MKALASNISNMLNEYKSTINIKKRDKLSTSRVAADLVSTKDSTVKPEITNSSNDHDESDRQNIFRLEAIGVKEGTAEGIKNIVRKDITKPILRTTDNSDFKSVYQYQIHQLFTAITEEAEIPEATNIRRKFVNIAGNFSIGWKQS